MKQTKFIQILGDYLKIRVLDFLIDNFNQDFSLPQIAQGSHTAYTTLIDLLPILLKQEMILETRQIGKSKLYQLNKDNPIIKSLIKFDVEINS